MHPMTASEQITEEVTSWPGVEAGPGRRGEFSFRVGRRELGHLHGDHAAHFSFPKDVWAELFAAGRVVHHPVFPGKVGPAARRIAGGDDVRDVIALMRLNYDRAVSRHGVPSR
jgi:luciferase-like monooxygenase